MADDRRRILVTGGTGTLGRVTAPALAEAGHDVRVLSRRDQPADATVTHVRADLRDTRSLAPVLAGTDTVLHLASDPRRPQEVDVAGTRALVDAAAQAGVTHLVHVSIVGVDRIPVALYRAKWEAERLVEAGAVPWTLVRATQFHPFLDRLFTSLRRLPVWPLPASLRLQPVDVGDVAARLVRAVAEGPAGRTADLGGPEVLPAGDLARQWLAVTGRTRLVTGGPLPGRVGSAMRAGHNICPDGDRGTVRFADWLAQHRQQRRG